MQLQQAQLGIRVGEDWEVRTPDQTVLVMLPRSLNDAQVVHILEFAQRYERLAHREGVEVGQGSMQAAATQRINALQDRVRSLEAHNEFLAETLERHLDGDQANAND